MKRPAVPALLCSASTRPAVLEALLVAHVLIDPWLLDGRTRPSISKATSVLLDVITEAPHCAGVALLEHVIIQLRAARHYQHYEREPTWVHWLQCTRRVRYRDVVRMAQRVTRLSVPDLTYLRREIVLELLGSVDQTPVAYIPPATDKVAPWKQRKQHLPQKTA